MIAVLHNIRSIHNVGSIFRTSNAAGIKKIILCGITPAPIDAYGRERSAFAKVSLGAEKTIAWESARSTIDTVKLLHDEGWIVWPLEQAPSSVPFWSYPVSVDILNRVALVVGNEVDGISTDVLDQCDAILHIPMYGEKESLNVAVAYGICVYSFLE